MSKLRWLALAVIIAAVSLARASNEAEFNPPSGIPADVWQYFVPRDNPVTSAKVELGRQLFFDKRLSIDSSVSCATCHDPKLAFTDGRPVAQGVGARLGKRNSPTLLNSMFNAGQFWDGRAESLEAQAIQPLINVDEMGNASHEQVVSRLRSLPQYVARFNDVFGSEITIDSLARALASFERTLISSDSPFDRFIAGDLDAMSDEARRGFAIFRGKARCTVCHSISQFSLQSFPFFTDQMFHNTGVAVNDHAFEPLAKQLSAAGKGTVDSSELLSIARREGSSSLGRFMTTGDSLDMGAFRTPSLRDVELTAPYFHDGSAKTLLDVVKFYTKAGNNNLNRDWELQSLSLTDTEQQELVEFLKSLTSDHTRRLVATESARVIAQ